MGMENMLVQVNDSIASKLCDFTVEELRIEIGILNGIFVPNGFKIGSNSDRSAFRGIIGLINPTSVYWHTALGDTGYHLTLVWNGEPGWSWYIDTKPGGTYRERGGDCLFLRALADAAGFIVDPTNWNAGYDREKMAGFQIPAWWLE